MSGGEETHAAPPGDTTGPVPPVTQGRRDALQVLVEHRRLATTCFAITLGLALLVTLLTPRRYTASTRVQVPSGSPTALATEVVALRSRDLAERVLRQHGLAADPLFHPEGGGVAGAPVETRLLDRYASYLSVRAAPDAGGIEVSFTTPSPALSALLAVAHAEAYQEANPDAPRSPIERPPLPTWPSRPSVPFNLVLGVGAGLVLAAGAAFAREVFDAGLETGEGISELLGLPTLAAIPDFAPIRRAPGMRSRVHRVFGANDGADARRDGRGDERHADDLVVVHAPASGPAEAFRRLGTTPLFSGRPPRIVLVTSARSAEGKTVASVNLAATLAGAGARVLVIDANLRHPRCHALLGVPNAQGLATYLAGEADLRTLVHDLDVPRLSFLPAGPVPENPLSLVGSGHMRGLLARLRDEYDCVVLDAPPVLPVTDAIVLARDADGVVLVVDARANLGVVVARARDRLAAVGAPVLGVMLNRVAPG